MRMPGIVVPLGIPKLSHRPRSCMSLLVPQLKLCLACWLVGLWFEHPNRMTYFGSTLYRVWDRQKGKQRTATISKGAGGQALPKQPPAPACLALRWQDKAGLSVGTTLLNQQPTARFKCGCVFALIDYEWVEVATIRGVPTLLWVPGLQTGEQGAGEAGSQPQAQVFRIPRLALGGTFSLPLMRAGAGKSHKHTEEYLHLVVQPTVFMQPAATLGQQASSLASQSFSSFCGHSVQLGLKGGSALRLGSNAALRLKVNALWTAASTHPTHVAAPWAVSEAEVQQRPNGTCEHRPRFGIPALTSYWTQYVLSGRLELMRWSSADSRARVTVGIEAATLLVQPRNDIPVVDRFRSRGGYQLGSAELFVKLRTSGGWRVRLGITNSSRVTCTFTTGGVGRPRAGNDEEEPAVVEWDRKSDGAEQERQRLLQQGPYAWKSPWGMTGGLYVHPALPRKPGHYV